MTVSLFALAADFRASAAQLADLDLPPEVVADTLESLRGEIEAKAANVGHFVLSLDASARAMKEAEKAMKERRLSVEKRAEQIKAYLLSHMVATGTLRIETPSIRMMVRDNPESVQIEDETQIPPSFMVTPPPQPALVPDKAALKAALKAGKDIPGARLARGQRVEIKI